MKIFISFDINTYFLLFTIHSTFFLQIKMIISISQIGDLTTKSPRIILLSSEGTILIIDIQGCTSYVPGVWMVVAEIGMARISVSY